MQDVKDTKVADAVTPPPLPARVHYIGFWLRLLAGAVDVIFLLFVLVPMAALLRLFGVGIGENDPYSGLIVHTMIAVVVLAFWLARMATPGKMVVNAVIVDAETLGDPGWKRYLARYLAYFVSILPLFLGLVWIAFDRRKQGWHDKVAGTVVIRRRQP